MVRYEYQVAVGDKLYGMADIQSAQIVHPLFDKLSVGNTCAGEFTMSFWPTQAPPRMAKLVPYIRQVGTTQWERLGEFYIDTRSRQGDLLSVTAYDPMLKGEVEWIPEDDMEFPMPMGMAAGILAGLMGLEVDGRSVFAEGYTIDYPAAYTVRNVLESIAAAHGGNWTVTQEGKLLLVPLFQNVEPYEIGADVSSLTRYDEVTVDGIALLVDDENEYRAGDQAGYVLEIECPYGTQQMADDLLQKLAGKPYIGFQAQAVPLSPLACLGDRVAFEEFTTFIAYRKVSFTPGHMSEISAPGENTVDHEYPYVSQTKREFTRKQAETRSLIEKSAGAITLSVEKQAGSLSLLSDTLDATREQYEKALEDIKAQMNAQLEIRPEGVEIEVKKILDDGVEKLTIGSNFLFDSTGLHVGQEGRDLCTTLNVAGMKAVREKGEKSEVIFQANEEGVVATDVTTRNFLIMGACARFEDYSGNRTACFYLGG